MGAVSTIVSLAFVGSGAALAKVAVAVVVDAVAVIAVLVAVGAVDDLRFSLL